MNSQIEWLIRTIAQSPLNLLLWQRSWDSQMELLALSRWKIRGTAMSHSLRGEFLVK